jgi:hypothetical protein
MPKVRIPPSERISKEIMEIIQNLTEHNRQKLLGQLMSADHLTQLRSKSGQLSMRKLVQESRFTGEVQEYSYECIRIVMAISPNLDP